MSGIFGIIENFKTDFIPTILQRQPCHVYTNKLIKKKNSFHIKVLFLTQGGDKERLVEYQCM